jgi:hypothetical protein
VILSQVANGFKAFSFFFRQFSVAFTHRPMLKIAKVCDSIPGSRYPSSI